MYSAGTISPVLMIAMWSIFVLALVVYCSRDSGTARRSTGQAAVAPSVALIWASVRWLPVGCLDAGGDAHRDWRKGLGSLDLQCDLVMSASILLQVVLQFVVKQYQARQGDASGGL